MKDRFCRLYLDTPQDRSRVASFIETTVLQVFPGQKVFVRLSRNDGHEPRPAGRRVYDPIAASPLTVEIETDCRDPDDEDRFETGVCALVIRLRRAEVITTAACDFEPRVAALTGWNWTSDDPEPPRDSALIARLDRRD